MKSINCSKPGHTSITCSKIEHIPQNLIFAINLMIPQDIFNSGTLNWLKTSYCTRIHPGFQWGLRYSIFSFLCNILQIVVCPFVLFLLGIVVLRLNFSSDYIFGTSLVPLWYLFGGTFKLTSHNICLRSMSHYYKISRVIQESM